MQKGGKISVFLLKWILYMDGILGDRLKLQKKKIRYKTMKR